MRGCTPWCRVSICCETCGRQDGKAWPSLREVTFKGPNCICLSLTQGQARPLFVVPCKSCSASTTSNSSVRNSKSKADMHPLCSIWIDAAPLGRVCELIQQSVRVRHGGGSTTKEDVFFNERPNRIPICIIGAWKDAMARPFQSVSQRSWYERANHSPRFLRTIRNVDLRIDLHCAWCPKRKPYPCSGDQWAADSR